MDGQHAIKPCLPASGFYGSRRRKHVLLQRSIESHVAAKKSHPALSAVKARIGEPVPFLRQQDAFQYAQSQSEVLIGFHYIPERALTLDEFSFNYAPPIVAKLHPHFARVGIDPCTLNLHFQKTVLSLHVFTNESDVLKERQGTCTYLVASYPVFWHYYQQLAQSQRHHYEIIPEGAVCKLYLDLEFVAEFNQGHSGSEMTQTLIKFVSACLEQFFSIECPSQYLLDLDSSTSSNFHRHLIYNVPNIAFKDNSHAGNFIRYIFRNVMDRVNQHEESESLSKSCNCINTSNTISNKQNVHRMMSNCEENETKNVSCHCTCYNTNQKSGTKHPSEQGNNTLQKCDKRPSEDNEISQLSGANCQDKVLISVSDDTEEGQPMDILSNMDRKMAAILKEFTHDELQSLIVFDEMGDQMLFCDTGVYSKNQDFLLYLSHKRGEYNPLRLTSPCCDAASSTKEKRQQMDRQTFFNSLITNVSLANDLRILIFDNVVHIRTSKKTSKYSPLPTDVLRSFSGSDNQKLNGDFDDLDDQFLVQVAEEAEVHYGPDYLSDEELLEAVNEAEQSATLYLME